MDDDPRVVDAPDPAAPDPAPGAAPDAPDEQRPARRWPRRLGLAALAVLLLVLSGLQIQVARMRTQAEEAETAQRIAELDEEAARIRLDSVGDRLQVARTEEADARAELGRAREDMATQGLEEPTLHDAQVATAKQVKDLRAQVRAVAADIAEQNRLQPAAGACLFDLLRALGDPGHAGPPSEACRTVAGASPGAT